MAQLGCTQGSRLAVAGLHEKVPSDLRAREPFPLLPGLSVPPRDCCAQLCGSQALAWNWPNFTTTVTMNSCGWPFRSRGR